MGARGSGAFVLLTSVCRLWYNRKTCQPAGPALRISTLHVRCAYLTRQARKAFPRGNHPPGGISMGDNKWLRNSFVYVIIMVAVLVLLFAFLNPRSADQSISMTQLANDVRTGQVASIKLQED